MRAVRTVFFCLSSLHLEFLETDGMDEISNQKKKQSRENMFFVGRFSHSPRNSVNAIQLNKQL